MTSERDAKTAMTAMARLTDDVEVQRAKRDAAVHDMHHVDGLTVPVIVRLLGLSKSMVRLILAKPRPGAGRSE